MQGEAIEGYLLDTNIASAATYEGSPLHDTVQKWLRTIGDVPVFVSAVTFGEVAFGTALARAQPQNARTPIPDSPLDGYVVLPIAREVAEIWGKLRATIFDMHAPNLLRRRRGGRSVASLVDRTTDTELGIQENDLWIVSVAVASGLIFVTADRGGGMRRVVDAASYSERTIYLPQRAVEK